MTTAPTSNPRDPNPTNPTTGERSDADPTTADERPDAAEGNAPTSATNPQATNQSDAAVGPTTSGRADAGRTGNADATTVGERSDAGRGNAATSATNRQAGKQRGAGQSNNAGARGNADMSATDSAAGERSEADGRSDAATADTIASERSEAGAHRDAVNPAAGERSDAGDSDATTDIENSASERSDAGTHGAADTNECHAGRLTTNITAGERSDAGRSNNADTDGPTTGGECSDAGGGNANTSATASNTGERCQGDAIDSSASERSEVGGGGGTGLVERHDAEALAATNTTAGERSDAGPTEDHDTTNASASERSEAGAERHGAEPLATNTTAGERSDAGRSNNAGTGNPTTASERSDAGATGDAGTSVVDSRIKVVGDVAFVGAAVAWVGVLGQILRHRIYVSHDTVINYAHVWYLSDRIWHSGGVPVRMPALGHGEAFAYPYGFVPWTLAALLRPLFADWTVTLVLVVATTALILATFWAFPELRRGWWATAVLVEPAMVSSPIIGQLSFVSGSALLLVAIGAWRRDKRALAVVAAGLAQATHPAIVLPLAATLVIVRLRWDAHPRALLKAYGLSLLVVVPALWATLHAPVVQEASLWVKAFGFVATIAPRSLIFAVPIALVLLRDRIRSDWLGPGIVSGLLVANVAMWVPLGMPWAWNALERQPDTRMVEFVESDDFVPGATYRLLRVADGKIGMYQLLRGGGRLDSEFFPESIERRSWPNTFEYANFLRKRHVDYVMVWAGYDRRFRTNEHALLEAMVESRGDAPRVTLVDRTPDFDLYKVRWPRPVR